MKGLLSGGAWGAVVGGLAVGMASLVAEQPAGNTPPAAPHVSAPQTTDQPDTQSAPPESVTVTTDSGDAPVVAPRVAQPEAEPQTPVADTQPASLPDTGLVTEAPSAPEPGETPQLVIAPEAPVLPNPQSVAPQIPLAEDDLVVATAPAPPPAPVVVQAPVVEALPEPVAQDPPVIVIAPEVAPEVVPEIDREVDVEPPAENPAAATDDPDALAMPEPETRAATAQDTAPVVAESPAEPVAPAIEAAPDVAQPEDDATAVTDPDDTAPTVVTIIPDPAPGLPTGDSDVRVNRPTASDQASNETAALPDSADTVAIPDADAPATERYGVDYTNTGDKPTVAVILIDDGSFAGAVPALAGIPFPVTVMLNPSSPDATEKMRAYRAAGIEVGVLAQLPEGAQPSDIEVFFEAAFSALPETVAVLDAGSAGFQSGNNAAITQTIAAIADDGRGLVTVSQGLNTAVREAEKAGVPTGTVYRDLDSEGQDARVIRRFMDQAAFRARQESGVVLLGRVRADTISALILWGTANRAGQVALVPVTAVFDEQ